MSSVASEKRITRNPDPQDYPDLDLENEDLTEDQDLNFDYEGGSSRYGEDLATVSNKQIRELYKKVDAKNLPKEEELLATLREALKYSTSPDEEKKLKASAAYHRISEQLNGTDEDDVLDASKSEGTGNDEEENQEGDAPTSEDKNGVKHYEAKGDLREFNLVPSGDGTKSIVKAKIVTITPKEETPVLLSKKGDKIVVTVGKDENKDIYEIDPKTEIHITSDNVTGDVDNPFGKITIGTEKTQKYISEKKFLDLASTLESSANKIGGELVVTDTHIFGPDDMGFRFPEGKMYGIESKWVKGKAMKTLNMMSEAFKETDPEKRNQKWVEITNEFSHVGTQNEGSNMDCVQLISVALHEELGEELFKDVIQNIIPSGFSKKMVSFLKASESEYKSIEAAQRVKVNIPGYEYWSHATFADFWEEHSKPSSNLAA